MTNTRINNNAPVTISDVGTPEAPQQASKFDAAGSVWSLKETSPQTIDDIKSNTINKNVGELDKKESFGRMTVDTIKTAAKMFLDSLKSIWTDAANKLKTAANDESSLIGKATRALSEAKDSVIKWFDGLGKKNKLPEQSKMSVRQQASELIATDSAARSLRKDKNLQLEGLRDIAKFLKNENAAHVNGPSIRRVLIANPEVAAKLLGIPLNDLISAVNSGNVNKTILLSRLSTAAKESLSTEQRKFVDFATVVLASSLTSLAGAQQPGNNNPPSQMPESVHQHDANENNIHNANQQPTANSIANSQTEENNADNNSQINFIPYPKLADEDANENYNFEDVLNLLDENENDVPQTKNDAKTSSATLSDEEAWAQIAQWEADEDEANSEIDNAINALANGDKAKLNAWIANKKNNMSPEDILLHNLKVDPDNDENLIDDYVNNQNGRKY